MKQSILYNLDQGAYQPYELCLKLGLNFYGGLAENEGLYLGILDGNQENIDQFLLDNQFNAKTITDQEAIEYFSLCINDYEINGIVVKTKQQYIDEFINIYYK